ncbi:MAG: glycosyltransferase [Acidobacteria bacterium]|nr:glycosyltransferase [Acidobacteriota bacterium]
MIIPVSAIPLVSIVTPSFNQGAFIAQTIDSVLAQDYANLEYLIMDGGSTDETLDVLRSYGSRIRWISASDGGQSAAINRGWQISQGEFLAWVNSDDLLKPGAIREAVSAFHQQPETAMVYGECDYIDQTGRIIGQYATRPFDYYDLLKSVANYLPQPSVFIRRAALESAGWLDESLHYLMDYDLYLRIGNRGSVAFIARPLAALRLHDDAKSLDRLAAFGEEMVRIIERALSSNSLPPELRSCRPEIMCNAYIYAASCSYWSGEIAQAKKWLRHAWRETQFPSFPRRLARLTLLAALGTYGRERIERWHPNPYTTLLDNVS